MEDIVDVNDPIVSLNKSFEVMSNAIKMHISTPTNNNQKILSNTRDKHVGNQYNAASLNSVGNPNGNVVAQVAWLILSEKKVGCRGSLISTPPVLVRSGSWSKRVLMAKHDESGILPNAKKYDFLPDAD
ncbi:hypothetical protein Tco_0706360 [Tanacetum coccineum]|uniref:Uncharacterized protein n=1 Tax=Tanacetum coccineum TaxID=301880 RepID=A0ABQ4Y767_9ASTR